MTDPVGPPGLPDSVPSRAAGTLPPRETEALWRLLGEPGGDAALLADEESGQVVEVSASAAALLARPAAQIVGRPQWSIHPPEAAEACRRRFRDRSAPARSGGTSDELVRADGTRVPVTLSRLRVIWKGRPCILTVCRDDSELCREQGTRRAAEERLRAVMDGMPEPLVVHNLRGRILDVNESACRLLGYAREELVGAGLDKIDSGRNTADYERRTREMLERGAIVFDGEHIRKDGTAVQVNISARLVSRDGEGVVHGYVRDISERARAEAAVRAERDRAQRYLDIAGVILVVLDREGRVELINRRGCAVLARPADEIVGQSWFERFVPEEDREATLAGFRKLMAGEVAPMEHFVNRVLARDGTRRLVAWHNTILRDAQDRITGTLSSGEDITARQQLEQELHIAHSAIDSSINAVAIADLTGHIEYVNEAFLTLWGGTREEAVGRQARSFWRDPVKAEGVLRSVFTRGAWVGTLEAERRNGSAFVAEVRASLVTEPDGRSLRLMATFLDVTDRRRAEAENRRLAMVVEQASELVLVTDASGAIQYVNPAFVQATGYSRAELVSQNPRILKSGVHDRAVYQELWDTILRGEVWRGHLVNRARDGRRLEVEAVITPLVGDDGKVANFVEVARDVTREVQLEKQFLQAQKMEAVGRLAGGVAHDFNNILQIISGFGELLFADFDRQDPRREDLRRILEAARKAQNLTAKLLAYSRRQMIEPRVVALNEIVAAQQPLLRRLVGEDVWMETRLAPDLWPVEADAGQIEQVIMNLVVNARDAMPHGGELIVSTANEEISAESAATRPEARPGRFVRLEVSDTGIGMDSAALEHLFEPFFTTKAPGKGTGLGLAMAYGLVKQHRGWMEVRSQRGQGSAFALFLPAVAGARVRAADDRAGTPPPRSARGEHILLVEDEEGIRLLTERVLREHGYRVTAAASGREALVRYGEEKGRFDLLFADVVLPDINGLDLVESILARQPGLKILLASGYTDERSRWPEIRGRGIRFLHKPYPVADMLRAVQEALVGPEPRASL